ncbi:hypothetical protein DH2020_045633 [Rehmannia glutinosa]|uniref:Uncharacterized protein n=1 Tax=Rehmannia glutinosa TaxID=99300 RepID=A0ABR0UDT1_REHGL
MEGPMSSSVPKNKNIVSENHNQAISEESGWTAYLEDFSCSNNDDQSFISSPSLVSDAAWNGSSDNYISPVKRLNFKNLKRNNNHKKIYSCDDDLEDTASSPVNSPKVSTLKQMEVNYRRLDDVAAGNFQGKQAGSTNFSELGTDEKIGKNNVVSDSRNIDQYVDLKKRGLCVVPMSALMNYFG